MSDSKNSVKTKGDKKSPPRMKIFFRIFLLMITGIAVLVIITYEPAPEFERVNQRLGEPAPKTIYAPFTFSYLDEEATRLKKESAGTQVLEIFDYDPKISENSLKGLETFFLDVQDLKNDMALGKEAPALENPKLPVSQEGVRSLTGESDLADLRDWVGSEIQNVMKMGVLDFSQKIELLNAGKRNVLIRNVESAEEKEISLKELLSATECLGELNRSAAEKFSKNKKIRSAVEEIFSAVLSPNLTLNRNETESRRKKVVDETPLVTQEIKKDEIILLRGQLVTGLDVKKLKELAKKSVKKKIVTRVLGSAIFVVLAFIGLGTYLYVFETRIFLNLKDLLLINTILLFVLLVERFILLIPLSFIQSLLPASVVSVLVALLLKPRVGVMMSFFIAAVNALLVNFSPEVILYSLFSGLAATFFSSKIRRRIQFLQLGVVVGLAIFAVIFGFQLLSNTPIEESFRLALFGFVNGVLMVVPLITLTLPIFEKIFGLLTDITLLELSDLNHPLLRRMVVEAPGTYHHSLVVSTLAESACQAIGANALLARVGSYFHDIGKIEKAAYFTENQSGKKEDKHEKLAPSMSFLIIASHIKDGIDLARRSKLKKAIIDFIPQHVGTGCVYYFYKKAQALAKGAEKVELNDFRYEGPKPQSRECSVVMLADSVEAASRSVTNPTKVLLESLVKKVINDKFVDGQFDECNLTLEDLKQIQESFVLNLMGIFHTRIAYPKSESEPVWQKAMDQSKSSAS